MNEKGRNEMEREGKEMKTRQEVERELMNLLEKAEEIVKEYSPNGGMVSMIIFGDNCLGINNSASYDHEKYDDNVIDVFKNREGTVWSYGFGEIKNE